MQKYRLLAVAIASAVACCGLTATTAGAQDPMLTGPLWLLEEIVYNNDTMTVPDDPEDYSIQFFDDGSLGVRVDCNVGNGIYEVDSSDFITLQAFTLAACGPESLDNEFRQGLSDAVNYFFLEGDLYMDLPVDTGTLKFVAAEGSDVEPEPEVEPDSEVEPAPEVEAPETVAPTEASEPIPGLW